MTVNRPKTMLPKTLVLRITPENLAWTGDKGHPKSAFNAVVTILGVHHHLEGWQVQTDKHGHQHAKYPHENHYDLVANEITQGAGRTIEIAGREYFCVLTPFQR